MPRAKADPQPPAAEPAATAATLFKRRRVPAAAVLDLADLAALPAHIDRRTAASLVARHFFPVSHRTIEAWPLTKRRFNGRAFYATAEVIAYAKAVPDGAAAVLGGRSRRKAAA